MNSSITHPPATPHPAFATTHWTRVLEARGDSSEARAALSELCDSYYSPVFAFIRRSTTTDDSARDLTQEFFSRLLSRNRINAVDPQRGRFRSYLLGAVKHFLADVHDHAHRQKRGAGQEHLPIESGTDTSPGLQLPDKSRLTPEQEFDRKWALTLLNHALAALAAEHETTDKRKQFDILKPWLTGDTENLSQADASRQLGLNEGAVKVAIHRLRRRFRELIKSAIGQTLNDPSQIDNELASLLAALSR